jgi:hypothetical protein
MPRFRISTMTARRTSCGTPTSARLTRNIIGTIGKVDTDQLPDAKGFASMQRHLIGDTDDLIPSALRYGSSMPQAAGLQRAPRRLVVARPLTRLANCAAARQNFNAPIVPTSSDEGKVQPVTSVFSQLNKARC